MSGFNHSVIWDIPGAATSLPAAIPDVAEPADPAGSKQALNFSGDRGYAGPCPPEQHTYQFTIYAIDTPTLAGVDLDTSREDVAAALAAAAIGSATLSGEYDPTHVIRARAVWAPALCGAC